MQTSPPVVYKNLVIVGSAIFDWVQYRNDPPGDVQAFDVRSGELVWVFRTIPRRGEFGADTWEGDSASFTGHVNVWPPMALDEERGLLYLPVGSPSSDYWGGRRHGANLFAESLVCLDAATGVRRWHFQMVHHGLWDYDPPASPILLSIRPGGGRTVDAVAQVTKQGLTFVFDRITGEPVWPIEERPVPTDSDVPGEKPFPTQPFPTRPPPFTDAGMSFDDAFDLTPELKAAAQTALRRFRLGPLYTPPSLRGTVQRPGINGGANWGSAAANPEAGVLFVLSSNVIDVNRVVPNRGGDALIDVDYTHVGNGFSYDEAAAGRKTFADGLPLNKPPYGHLTAIDLNEGSIRWRVPFGEGSPALRAHPALKGVTLPARLGTQGNTGPIATAGGLLFIGGGDPYLYAFDAATGREVWRTPTARRTSGNPMTYRTRSGRQFVIIATGGGTDAAMMAYALPGRPNP
jgi:quinoprotein glucose dehydrogenase